MQAFHTILMITLAAVVPALGQITTQSPFQVDNSTRIYFNQYYSKTGFLLNGQLFNPPVAAALVSESDKTKSLLRNQLANEERRKEKALAYEHYIAPEDLTEYRTLSPEEILEFQRKISGNNIRAIAPFAQPQVAADAVDTTLLPLTEPRTLSSEELRFWSVERYRQTPPGSIGHEPKTLGPTFSTRPPIDTALQKMKEDALSASFQLINKQTNKASLLNLMQVLELPAPQADQVDDSDLSYSDEEIEEEPVTEKPKKHRRKHRRHNKKA